MGVIPLVYMKRSIHDKGKLIYLNTSQKTINDWTIVVYDKDYKVLKRFQGEGELSVEYDELLQGEVNIRTKRRGKGGKFPLNLRFIRKKLFKGGWKEEKLQI